MESAKLESCIVRVESLDGQPKGTGFVITPTLAVTCAHVIEACGAGASKRVRLAFHAGGVAMEAEVLADGWHPNDDVAFLRLADTLPSDVMPAILGPSAETDGHRFRTLGYPHVGEFRGVWASGMILGQVKDERGGVMLQLRSPEIGPGVSGAPVIDVNANRVVAMVTLTYQTDATLKYRDAAFAVLPETLRALRREEIELDAPRRISGSSFREIPLLPEPYIAHPYPLAGNFTGRIWEREMLTDWLRNDVRSILTLVAMGGMGKTSLAWMWLKNDVDQASFDGILWWSFYEGESSLSRFLDEAVFYTSSEPFRHKLHDLMNYSSDYEKVRSLCSRLRDRRVLLVLDGFERQLRAYSGVRTARQLDNTSDVTLDARSCVDPNASRLLRDLVTDVTQAKVLITSRLMVRDLEDRAGDPLAGCRKEVLNGLHPDDAVRFLEAQGVKADKRSEIIKVCEEYGFHPLSLRLLSGLITRDKRDPGSIRTATRHDVHRDLVGRQHHVLEAAYNALPDPLRELLSRIAAFRSATDFEALAVVGAFLDEARFEKGLDELVERALLNFDTEKKRFHLHPVVRAYAYERLKDKYETHCVLRTHLQPQVDSLGDTYGIPSIELLTPVIELYHHMVSAGSYDDAQDLFYNKLYQPLYYQFNAYGLFGELMKGLFVEGETNPPALTIEARQSWCMTYLTRAYCGSGHLRRGIPIIEKSESISREAKNWSQLAVALETKGYLIQFQLGRLAAAEQLLRESVGAAQQGKRVLDGKPKSGSLDADDERQRLGRIEGLGYRHLATVLAHCGRYEEAQDLLEKSDPIFEAAKRKEYMSGRWAAWATLELLRGDPWKALDAALDALDHSTPRISQRGVARSWRLLATSHRVAGDLDQAEDWLDKALKESRRINRLGLETDALLEFAALRRKQATQSEADRIQLYRESREYAYEALAIADRCEYRLKQADIHNFLGQWELDVGSITAAREHAAIANERAWCDGPPHSYKAALATAEKLLRQTDQQEG